jgi:hypothetical protein
VKRRWTSAGVTSAPGLARRTNIALTLIDLHDRGFGRYGLFSGLVASVNLMSTRAFKTETTERWTRKRFSLVVVAVALSVFGYLAFRTMRGLMMLGYVDSAIGRVRAVSAAETQFAKAHPELGYACTLSQLPHDEQILRLAKDGKDNGYVFDILGCQAPEPKKPNSMYHITARPLHPDFRRLSRARKCRSFNAAVIFW